MTRALLSRSRSWEQFSLWPERRSATGLSPTDGCVSPFLWLLACLTFRTSKAGCKPALRQNENCWSWTLVAVLLGSALPTLAASSPASTTAGTNSAAAKLATTNSDKARADAVPVFAPIPPSVFVIPKTRKDGVDPFFPLSKRLEVNKPINPTNPPVGVGELMVKGFSGSVVSPLVIINDRTVGVGDVGEVNIRLTESLEQITHRLIDSLA